MVEPAETPEMTSHSKSTKNEELRLHAVYLRYFTLAPTSASKRHYRYQDIATMTGLSVSKVTQFCLGALPGNEGRYGPKNRSRKYNLTQEQLQYLLSDATLKAWAGLSCTQRCKLFHRQFPNVHIPPTYLGQVYKKHDIRLKFVRTMKVPPPSKQEEREVMKAVARQQLQEALT